MELERIANEITQIRARRLDIYNRLIDTSEEQKAILLSGDHSKLSENIASFDPLIMELNQTDKYEAALSQRLDRMRTDSDCPAIKEADAINSRISKELLVTAGRLRDLTQENAQLLENFKRFVDFTISIICKAASDQSTEAASAGPSLLLNAKV